MKLQKKVPNEYIREGKISIGKILRNGCQFANIYPLHIIALYSTSSLSTEWNVTVAVVAIYYII